MILTSGKQAPIICTEHGLTISDTRIALSNVTDYAINQ